MQTLANNETGPSTELRSVPWSFYISGVIISERSQGNWATAL
jgi:hypothetical protein